MTLSLGAISKPRFGHLLTIAVERRMLHWTAVFLFGISRAKPSKRRARIAKTSKRRKGSYWTRADCQRQSKVTIFGCRVMAMGPDSLTADAKGRMNCKRRRASMAVWICMSGADSCGVSKKPIDIFNGIPKFLILCSEKPLSSKKSF